jgi:iron complex transport system ATP-binding protein
MIACRGLSIGYHRRALLEGLTFELGGGEVWALVGRNGSGKSTLLATLSGLRPKISGSIEVAGRALESWSRYELATLAGFLPQPPRAIFPFDIAELLSFGRLPWRKLGRTSAAEDAAEVAAAIESMNLGPLAHRRLTTVSSGEAQRVWIGQLLVQRPRLLLMDEPLANLDLLHQLSALRLFRGLAAAGRGVLMVVHDLRLAWRYSDRLLVLGPGGARLVQRADDRAVSEALQWAYGVRFDVHPEHGPVAEIGDIAAGGSAIQAKTR